MCGWAWVCDCCPPFLAGVLGCVCVCVRAPPYPATPGWGVWCGCVCVGSGFGCAPPLLAGVLGCVRVCVRAPLVPRHSWLGCAVWVRVFGLVFRLRPATPGWGVGCVWCLYARSACTLPLLARVCGVGACVWARVSAAPCLSWLGCWGVCVCLCARSACTPPLLAGVCDVGVGVWARVPPAPGHSWLGRWGVCVFVCVLRLYPGTPGWGVRCGCVCLGSGFGCAPPLLAGVLGCVCVCVRAPLVPRRFWLGCAVWVCVLGLGFWLRPATPGRGVGVCVCVCVRATLVPRHSRLGCAVWVWVLGLWFWLRPATPGWGVGVCVCSCAHSACSPPLLAAVCDVDGCVLAPVSASLRHSWLGCWGVCLFVCALRLYPATLGWGVRCGGGCLGSGFGCAPPLLAGALGCLCACVRAPLVPRHPWPGCAVWVCVFGLGSRLRPATPGWGVGVCVCLCARFACTPPLLAGVCGVGVCAWARVSAPPRHSWLGCCGVCLFLCALRLYPATRGWGVRCGCVCLGSGFGCEAGSDPRGHLWVTWGVYLCAGKPPLADIILSHPPDLPRCDSVIGLAIPAMSGHIQYRGAAS